MNCPQCNIALVMAERQGVEIDYCPQCRGVWLDRGELDKIIQRSERDDDDEDRPRNYPPPPPRSDYDRDREHHYKYQKKKSFWSEIFD